MTKYATGEKPRNYLVPICITRIVLLFFPEIKMPTFPSSSDICREWLLFILSQHLGISGMTSHRICIDSTYYWTCLWNIDKMKTEVMIILIIYFCECEAKFLCVRCVRGLILEAINASYILYVCKLQNWNIRAIHVTHDMAHDSIALSGFLIWQMLSFTLVKHFYTVALLLFHLVSDACYKCSPKLIPLDLDTIHNKTTRAPAQM